MARYICPPTQYWIEVSRWSGVDWDDTHDGSGETTFLSTDWIYAAYADYLGGTLYRGGLFFDSSGIPLESIGAAKLCLWLGTVPSVDFYPDSLHIVRAPDLHYGTWDVADYEYLLGCTESLWSRNYTAQTMPVWTEIGLPTAALADIKKGAGAITSFGVRFGKDVNDIDPGTAWIYRYAGKKDWNGEGTEAYLEVITDGAALHPEHPYHPSHGYSEKSWRP